MAVTMDDCEGTVLTEETWRDLDGGTYAALFIPEDYGFTWPGDCTESEPCQFQRCIHMTVTSGSDVEVVWNVDATLLGGWSENTRPTSSAVEIEFEAHFIDE